MAAAKSDLKINLLPQKEFEKGTLGRTVKWLLSSFRVIVIFTEMLVMAAFLSRFWLDAQNSDLNESLAQKTMVITSFAEVEKNFKDAQKRLSVFAKAIPQPQVSDFVKTVVSYLPTGVTLKSVSESEKVLQITGTSGDEQQIAQFVANLESIKPFKDVVLTQINSDQENQSLTAFTVKINL